MIVPFLRLDVGSAIINGDQYPLESIHHMLQLACHAWAYNNRSLEEAIGTIARLGFRYIDIGSGTHFDPDRAAYYPADEAGRIRALLEQANLHISDLYLMLPYINAPDPSRRAGQIALFERLLPFALALGTPGITVSPGIYHADGHEHAFARSIPALLHMSEIMEDLDLRFCFEPHMDSSVLTPEEALMMVECVPGLNLTLDYAHFIVQGYKLADLTALLPYTAHVHVRQAVKGRLQTPFSQGRIDLDVMMRDLLASGYRGTLTIEYMTTIGWHGMMPVNITQETAKTRDVLRGLRQ